MNYTGINKLFKFESLQIYLDRWADGTFEEFLDDWRWIFKFSARYKWVVVFYTILGLVSSSLALGSSYVSAMMLNIITTQDTEHLWLLALIMVGSLVLSLTLGSVMSRVNCKIGIYVNNDIQGVIFDKIIDSKWSELNKYENGDLMNRFNGDVGTISGNAICWIPNLIINIYTFIMTFVVLFTMDYILAWIAILSAPVLLLMSHFIMQKQKEYRKKVLEMNSKMMSFEMEAFYNFDNIKSFGIIKYYSQELRSWQQKYKIFNLDYNMFQIKTNIMLTMLSTAVGTTAFGYCLYRLWTGQILYGDMMFFMQQRSALSGRFNALAGTIPGMLNSSISAHRVRELVDLEKEEHDPESARIAREMAPEGLTLEVRDVTFSYTDGKDVYHNASLVARPHEMIAVLGESGGGKTTLFRLLLGLIHPDEGSVLLTTADGRELNMNCDLRELISYVPQGNSAILGTVAENLRMVKEDATDEELIRALKISQAWEFVEPMGLDAPIKERGKGLSEGQSQRLAIARAILRDAPILMLDEATSALDSKTEELVLDAIAEYAVNKTVIVATHRPSILSRCQRVYRIEDNGLKENAEGKQE